VSDKAWKALERRVARFFGGERNALSGRNSKAGSSGDVLHPNLYVECKQRVRHSAVTLWDKTNAEATKEGKLPVVVLAEKNRPGFWVLVHSDDLKAVGRAREQFGKEGEGCLT